MRLSRIYEAVEEAGMGESVRKPKQEELAELSPEQLLGCIAWHFRADHFDNGCLIRGSIADGHMLRMLKAYEGGEKRKQL